MRKFTFTMRQAGKSNPRSGTSNGTAGRAMERLEPRALFSASTLSFTSTTSTGMQSSSLDGGDSGMGGTSNKIHPTPPKYPGVTSVFSTTFNIAASTFI